MIGPYAVEALPQNMQTKIQVDADTGCWTWTAAKNPKGYGSVSNGNNGSMLAHRRSYTEMVGPIPAGLTIDHLCRNKSCINPAHLEPVTCAENTRRNYVDACAKGHAWTPETTYTRSNGARECTICRYDRWVARLGRTPGRVGRPSKSKQ